MLTSHNGLSTSHSGLSTSHSGLSTSHSGLSTSHHGLTKAHGDPLTLHNTCRQHIMSCLNSDSYGVPYHLLRTSSILISHLFARRRSHNSAYSSTFSLSFPKYHRLTHFYVFKLISQKTQNPKEKIFL